MSQSPGGGGGGGGLAVWVRMKGLPARVTAADIEAFFDGLQLAPQSPILFKRHADGRTTGAVSGRRYRRKQAWLAVCKAAGCPKQPG